MNAMSPTEHLVQQTIKSQLLPPEIKRPMKVGMANIELGLEIEEMRERGMTYREIGHVLGRSKSSLSAVVSMCRRIERGE